MALPFQGLSLATQAGGVALPPLHLSLQTSPSVWASSMVVTGLCEWKMSGSVLLTSSNQSYSVRCWGQLLDYWVGAIPACQQAARGSG